MNQEMAPKNKVSGIIGTEYVFMNLSLVVAAGSLIGCLLGLASDASDASVMAFSVSALIVSLPVFTLLFLHLKGQEVRTPALRQSITRRYMARGVEVGAFLTCLGAVIGLLFVIFSPASDSGSSASIRQSFLNAFCVIVVAGVVLAYYLYDEAQDN